MLSLGLGIGLGFGSRAPVVPAPPNIITSVPVQNWFRADLGASVTAGKLVTLNDQVGTLNVTQATGADQPTYTATDSTFNNLATFTTDGLSKYLANASAVVNAPQQTIFSIMKLSAATGASYLYSSNRNHEDGCALYQYIDGNLYQLGNGANCNSLSLTTIIGNWALFIDRRLNNTSDYIRAGSVVGSGTPCGPTGNIGTPYPWSIGGYPGDGFAAATYREIVICNGEPMSGELTALKAYFVAQLSGLLV